MASKPTLPTTNQNTKAVPAVEGKARGPNRTSKSAHKLKVLPEQPETPPNAPVTSDEDREETTASGDDELEPEDEDEAPVYKQISQIPAGTARRDALRLTKKQKAKLPRVTAYCTANSYKMPELLKFFMARKEAYRTAPKQFDEVIYTPYSYESIPASSSPTKQRPPIISKSFVQEGDLLGVPELRQTEEHQPEHNGTNDAGHDQDDDPEMTPLAQAILRRQGRPRFDSVSDQDNPSTPEVFLFDYGTVVIWGMTEAQEKRFLHSLRKFEVEKLPPDDVESEDLNYYYANYSRIYNDVITLRKGSSYMTKLALSHALAQSVKISLFEELISNTIDQTKDIPEVISETGKIGMPHNEIMQQIGQLFILRMNINLVGSVLDSPELFWSFPDLQPLYDAARSYLEIPQRVDLLNARVEVLQDMLRLLKESVSSRHAERLEQIVIFLIGIEIILGIVTIAIDLFSAYE
ncbi:hypothetical protein FRC04_010416 [Tulasnella sp. 424]|nr:hypothetical protein FRC04_010416 [Tulasnella sp. 424]KAG8978649.1 hypothetical protein FRC05_009921 [Tulasnella sp. 425]